MRNYDSYRKNLKVLFVKSDSYSRNVSLKVLKENFKDITVAENGLEAYMMFLKNRKDEENCFDLIITDVNTQYINGIQMLERIRKVDNIPFIFLTTDNNYKTVLKAAQLHILNYIVKPLTFDNVKETINKSCEKLYKRYITENLRNLVVA